MRREDKLFHLWRQWLTLVCTAGIGFGLLLPYLSTIDLIAGGYQQRLADTFFPGQAFTFAHTDFLQWVWTTLGGVIAAWGSVLLLLVRYPFARGEPWAWWAISLSAAIAFAVDISAALQFGFYIECAVALAWFLPLALPLLATYSVFHTTGPTTVVNSRQTDISDRDHE